MRAIPTKIKPASGYSHFVHILLNAVLPALVLILVRANFVPLAAALILLSKWRMLAVRPRYWPANIRANAVDITVGLSVIIFIANSSSGAWQLVWAVAYAIWLIIIKPGTSIWKTSVQALLAQLAGLMAVFLAWPDASLAVLVLLGWVICYGAARHFFTSFDEPYTALYAHTWGYFAAALIWLLGHWLLFYGDGVLAQPTLLLTVIGYGLATLYYLEQTDRLSVLLRRQFIFIMVAIVIVVLAFSRWGGVTV
jgi:hypothetical protein